MFFTPRLDKNQRVTNAIQAAFEYFQVSVFC